jgi:predicted GNAT family N-acyltransferase
MQPTGRSGADLRAGGTLHERAVERRLVRGAGLGLQLMRQSLDSAYNHFADTMRGFALGAVAMAALTRNGLLTNKP